MGLSAQPQPLDDGPVSFSIFFLQISQLSPSLPYQLEQTSTRVLIVFVKAQVSRQLDDAGGQQRDLYLWRTGIAGMNMILLNQALFLSLGEWHNFLLDKYP
jgi:hypothetical protein